jgi:hypothetical protein
MAMCNMTPQKMRRKIGYLRSMGVPNVEGGATCMTWRKFFYVLHKLKLTKKQYHSY